MILEDLINLLFKKKPSNGAVPHLEIKQNLNTHAFCIQEMIIYLCLLTYLEIIMNKDLSYLLIENERKTKMAFSVFHARDMEIVMSYLYLAYL